ncbi:MAG: hypothetical protein WAV28_16645, partial [Sedimentisphaerales bacterium]
MKKFAFLSFLILFAMTLPACDEVSLQKIDKTVQDVNNIAGGARDIIESPAGQMIPPNVKVWGLLGVQ